MQHLTKHTQPVVKHRSFTSFICVIGFDLIHLKLMLLKFYVELFYYYCQLIEQVCLHCRMSIAINKLKCAELYVSLYLA